MLNLSPPPDDPARDRRAKAKAKVDMHDELLAIARNYVALILSDYETSGGGIGGGMGAAYNSALAVIAKAEALK